MQFVSPDVPKKHRTQTEKGDEAMHGICANSSRSEAHLPATLLHHHLLPKPRYYTAKENLDIVAWLN
jgi:hypothetical protein